MPDDPLGRVERVMYLTAAMTGMRQGELFALRWRDVDWSARRIRVRRNYVRGEFGTPKSKRSSRSVPLASRVATELELLFQDSPSQARRRPRVRAPRDRQADRSLEAAQALQGRARAAPMFAPFASTTSGTRSARGWPRRACRCASCRR